MLSVNSSELSNPTLTANALLSNETRVILLWLLYGSLLPIISTFGIMSNIINIICFVRQGPKDPVNVSLLGLAVSDLLSLTNSFCISICYNPTFEMLDLPVEEVDLVFIVFGPPHFLFSGLTSWITTLITLERCFCVTMPIKVKSIITAGRVIIIIVCLFIAFTCSVSLFYCMGELSWVFSPERNRTILRLVFTEDSQFIEQISYMVNSALIPFSAYITIIICTFTLVAKLRTKAKWRMTCTTSHSSDNTSKRDQKVATMVLAVSTVFIACYTPMCAVFVLIMTMPELGVFGSNQNLLFVLGGINIVLESANSSANIFFYYHMSSRYKSMFKDLFKGMVICSQDHTVCRKCDAIESKNIQPLARGPISDLANL